MATTIERDVTKTESPLRESRTAAPTNGDTTAVPGGRRRIVFLALGVVLLLLIAGRGAGAPGRSHGAQGARRPGEIAAPRSAGHREQAAARCGADGGRGGGRAARGGAGGARRRRRSRGGGPRGARPRGAAALLHARHRADGGCGEQEECRGGPAGAAGAATHEPGVAG